MLVLQIATFVGTNTLSALRAASFIDVQKSVHCHCITWSPLPTQLLAAHGLRIVSILPLLCLPKPRLVRSVRAWLTNISFVTFDYMLVAGLGHERQLTVRYLYSHSPELNVRLPHLTKPCLGN